MPTRVTVKKDKIRLAFGGMGFHNADATNYKMMSKRHFNEVVAKTWRELSPGFSRIWGGAPNWSREDMDTFVEYYHQMHGVTDTPLYLTGSTTRQVTQEDKIKYAVDVADRLEYLIRDKGLKNIVMYCMSNELTLDTWGEMFYELETFKEYHTLLFREFKRRNLPVVLAATDAAPSSHWESVNWAVGNMAGVTGVYCAHDYAFDWYVEDVDFYKWFNIMCQRMSNAAGTKEKRFILGEFGLGCDWDRINGMLINDSRYFDTDKEAESALMVADMALAAFNANVYAMAYWTLNDYPNPEGMRWSRTVKWGLTRWDGDDYSARDNYYCYGLLAKYFNKNSKPMTTRSDAYLLHSGGVANTDGSVSVALNNRGGDALDVELELDCPVDRPMRVYVYDSANVPRNDFADLQPHSDVIAPVDGRLLVKAPARSLLLLTTDYRDNKPGAVGGVKMLDAADRVGGAGRVVVWDAANDENHCYYRVYRDGIQVASTVADSYEPPEKDESAKGDTGATGAVGEAGDASAYTVKSVDKWGNEGQ